MRNKGKILITLGGLLSLTGGDKHALEIAFHLCSDYEVHLVLPCHMYNRLMDEEKLSISPIIYHPISCPPTGKTRPSKLLRYFIYILKGFFFTRKINRRFDVIYCPSTFLERFAVAINAKKENPDAKFIAWLHHIIPSPMSRARYKGGLLFERILDILSYSLQQISILLMKKYADVIFTPTNYTKEKIMKRNISCDRVKQIDNGVDLEYFDSIESEGKKYDGCTIGISPKKGPFDLLAAWAIGQKEMKNAKLVIIGPLGEWREYLQDLIWKLFLKENVILTDYVPEDEKVKILKSSRLFMCPSYEEGWSISISEAATCGLPIIAYDNQVFREVYGNSILYVPQGNIDQLAKTIVAILKDQKVLYDYSNRARKWAATHSWKKIAEKERRIIETILSR